MIDGVYDFLAHSGAEQVRDAHRDVERFHEPLGDLSQLDQWRRSIRRGLRFAR
jgi:hypothetical protein